MSHVPPIPCEHVMLEAMVQRARIAQEQLGNFLVQLRKGWDVLITDPP